MAPSVDRDTSPTWSHDGKRIAFIRRPGCRSASRPSRAAAESDVPNGPAVQSGGAGRTRYSAQGRGGGRRKVAGRAAGGVATAPATVASRAAGARADAGDVPRRLHAVVLGRRSGDAARPGSSGTPAPDERVFTNVNAIQWAGDHVMFTVAVPNDEWERYFSVAIAGPITAAPVLLTTTNGIIEDATSVALSKDGRTLFYTTNHGDIDRRHVWAVPTAGGTPKQVSTGDGIETSPMPLAAGTHVAALTADAKRAAVGRDHSR